MKSRLVSVLALCLLSLSLVGLTESSASAAAFPARLSRTAPIVGEVDRVYGSVPPATRPVVLQKYAAGRWVRVAAKRTTAGGRYTFNVRATASTVTYRTSAPATKIKRKKWPARLSNLVRVRGVQQSLSLAFVAAPIGAAPTGNGAVSSLLTPGVATFSPARPGTGVALYRQNGAGWTYVGTALQDSTGHARYNVNIGSADAPQTFLAKANPGSGVPVTNSARVVPPYPSAPVFDDNFDGYALDPGKWTTRFQDYTPGTGRHCARPADDRVAVASGVATLSVHRLTSSSQPNCPYGVWDNAMIGTPDMASPYGYYAARVMFQGSRGMHGSFWLQGSSAGSTEIDTAEYFGDGRKLGGLSSFVHRGSNTDATSAGGELANVPALLGKGKTPSNGWHVYSVQWSPSGYIFRIDGIPTFSTSQLLSSVPEQMVLSLLTSDWELPSKPNASSVMRVDWVRAWQ